MNTVRDICQYIGERLMYNSWPTICIETGCSYVCSPGGEEHTTTNNIYTYISQPNGIFYSIDIDRSHIEFAENFIGDIPQGAVMFLEGDSVGCLKKLNKVPTLAVDVLCLDSKEFDEDHMVNEYQAIKSKLRTNHFILVDDIHNPNSVKYKKLAPLLSQLGYNLIEVPTPTGMLVAAKGYSLP